MLDQSRPWTRTRLGSEPSRPRPSTATVAPVASTTSAGTGSAYTIAGAGAGTCPGQGTAPGSRPAPRTENPVGPRAERPPVGPGTKEAGGSGGEETGGEGARRERAVGTGSERAGSSPASALAPLALPVSGPAPHPGPWDPGPGGTWGLTGTAAPPDSVPGVRVTRVAGSRPPWRWAVWTASGPSRPWMRARALAARWVRADSPPQKPSWRPWLGTTSSGIRVRRVRAPGGLPLRPVSQPSSCQRTRSAMTAAMRAGGSPGPRERDPPEAGPRERGTGPGLAGRWEVVGVAG